MSFVNLQNTGFKTWCPKLPAEENDDKRWDGQGYLFFPICLISIEFWVSIIKRAMPTCHKPEKYGLMVGNNHEHLPQAVWVRG